MARRYSSNASGSMMTVISVAIIVVVLALGIFAVSGKISTNINVNKAAKGDSSIGYAADQAGMELEDYLAQYGLTSDDAKAKDSVMDVANKMTLENFAKFAWGVELTDEEFAAFKADQEIGDDVTKDTKDEEVRNKFNTYQSAKKAEEEAAKNAESEAGASVNAELDTEAAAE
ncbi:MAG: hypothetical protein PUD92_09325 [Clostridiales bacterium]|nr:hypothetical protein [Clostridiales bacterium]